MKKAAFPIVCTLFILLGIGFAVLYGIILLCAFAMGVYIAIMFV